MLYMTLEAPKEMDGGSRSLLSFFFTVYYT